VNAPAIVLQLARALPGWEIRLGVQQPEGLCDEIFYCLSARDERNSRAILTVHGEWLASPSDSARTLIAELLRGGCGLSDEEAKGVRALLPGGGL
jgi:hypothetical protein